MNHLQYLRGGYIMRIKSRPQAQSPMEGDVVLSSESRKQELSQRLQCHLSSFQGQGCAYVGDSIFRNPKP